MVNLNRCLINDEIENLIRRLYKKGNELAQVYKNIDVNKPDIYNGLATTYSYVLKGLFYWHISPYTCIEFNMDLEKWVDNNLFLQNGEILNYSKIKISEQPLEPYESGQCLIEHIFQQCEGDLSHNMLGEKIKHNSTTEYEKGIIQGYTEILAIVAQWAKETNVDIGIDIEKYVEEKLG